MIKTIFKKFFKRINIYSISFITNEFGKTYGCYESSFNLKNKKFKIIVIILDDKKIKKKIIENYIITNNNVCFKTDLKNIIECKIIF